MRTPEKRKTFNVTIIVLIAILAVVLIYTAWGSLKALVTNTDELPPPPERVTGDVDRTAPPADGQLDTTTLDQAARKPTAAAPPQTLVLTLPNGARVRGTEAEADLQRYLASDAAAGRRIPLSSLHFVEWDEVRQDPDGAITTLAAILNAFPEARVRVEVVERNPQMYEPRDRAAARAQAVARAIVSAGVDAGRVTHVGVKSQDVDIPVVSLVVVDK